MNYYDNYFKNIKEIESVFCNETLKFEFFTDGFVFFKTLNPIVINEELFNFNFKFRNDEENDFFCYEKINDLITLKLYELKGISEDNKNIEIVFFN